jgi:hypothetical protein
MTGRSGSPLAYLILAHEQPELLAQEQKPHPAFLADSDLEYINYWRLEDRPSWQHKIEHYFLTDFIPIRHLERPRLRGFWKVGSAFRYAYWRTFYRHRWSFRGAGSPSPGWSRTADRSGGA